MHRLRLALVSVALGAPLCATPPLDFSAKPFPLPPLSLADAAKRLPRLMPLEAPADKWVTPAQPSPEAPKTPAKPLGQMPVIVPRDDLDPQMVHAPKPGVDYKLIIVPPEKSR